MSIRWNTLLMAVMLSLVSLGGQAGSLPEEKARLSADAFAKMAADLGLREAAVPSRDHAGWTKPQKIVVWMLDGWDLAELQAVAPAVEIVGVDSIEAAEAAIGDAQAMIGACSERLLSRAPAIAWVQVYSSGVDRCVGNPSLREGRKILTNGQRIASPALAEHAIALMMGLVRGIDLYHGNQGDGKWRREVGLESSDFMELDGRTVLVVGLGGIGTQVARKAHGLGMRVLATRGSRREGPDYVEYVGLADETLTLAAQADIVINTAPLTDATRGMFNRAFFAAMKPSAYFVSVGRGASTVTADLVAALDDGEIAGAGLDVTDPEPLPQGHPLWTAPRVLITPHTGGRSDRGRQRLFLLVQENLRRYVAGEPLYSVVDVERGY